MIELCGAGMTLLQFERLAREPGLVHGFTTRPQNYAPHRGIGAEGAVDARHRACELLGVSFDRLVSPQQVHGAELVVVTSSDVGCGREGRDSALRFVDGLACGIPGVPLILMSADCPLVCAYDPGVPAVGATHASWQGTVAGATRQMIQVMQRELGCEPARMLAAIAPSAGPCCYEVGEEVRRIAATRMPDVESFFRPRAGKYLLDLWSANRAQLTESGVPDARIETAGLCSICDPRFWSHRRDGATAGRSALIVGLRIDQPQSRREHRDESQAVWHRFVTGDQRAAG